MKIIKLTLLTTLICLGNTSPVYPLNLPSTIKQAWINYPQTKESVTLAAASCAAIMGLGIDIYCLRRPNRGTKGYAPLCWLLFSMISVQIAQNIALIPFDYCYKQSLDDLSTKINSKAFLTQDDIQKIFALFQYQLEHDFYDKRLRAEYALNSLMGYDYNKINFFTHPQLNNNQDFVAMFLDECLKEVNNTKHLKDKTLATTYANQHPDFVKAYVQRIQEDRALFYVDGICADVIVQTYIQNYMQPEEIERLYTFLLKRNLPESTELIKQYMIDK